MVLIHRASVIFDTGLYGLMKLISTWPLHLTLMSCVFAEVSCGQMQGFSGHLSTPTSKPVFRGLRCFICPSRGGKNSYQSFSFLSCLVGVMIGHVVLSQVLLERRFCILAAPK